MARNVKYHFADCHLELEAVDAYYRKSLASIECRYSKDTNTHYDVDFLNMTSEEVIKEAKFLKEELEKDVIFKWLACIEALLRIDYIIRLDKKDKKPLSCYFRNRLKQNELQQKKKKKTLKYKTEQENSQWQSNKKYHVDLCNEIIKGWREFYPKERNYLNLLCDAFQYRNWLAHGRYRRFDDESKYSFWMLSSLVSVFKEDILIHLQHY